jgi:hypothetical protein
VELMSLLMPHARRHFPNGQLQALPAEQAGHCLALTEMVV